MTHYIFILLFLFQFIQLIGKDTIQAENFFKHHLTANGFSDKKYILKQNTYDPSSGRLIHSLEYDPDSRKIAFITEFFYQDSLLISKEKKSIENEIIWIERYSYNSDNTIAQVIMYKPMEEKVKYFAKFNREYKAGRISKEIHFNSEQKWSQKHKYSYEDQKDTRTSKYSSPDVYNGIKQEITSTFYRGNIRIKESLKIVYFNGNIEESYRVFETDKLKGKPTLEKHFDSQDNLTKQIRRAWNPDGSLLSKATLDPNNEYLEYISCTKSNYKVHLNKQSMYPIEE